MSIRQSVKNIFAIKEMNRVKSLESLLNKLEVKKEEIKLYLDEKHDNKDIMDKEEELTLINFHINKGKKLLASI